LLVVRESEEVRFQAVSILNGKPVNLSGLAERIGAVQMKREAGELTVSVPETKGGPNHIGKGGLTCLAERIRLARERVAKARDLDSTL
jgi:hypothetical protein